MFVIDFGQGNAPREAFNVIKCSKSTEKNTRKLRGNYSEKNNWGIPWEEIFRL